MTQRDLVDKLTANSSIDEVQDYIKKVIALRGFDREPIENTMLLLLEETGELAKSIRKAATKMSVDVAKLHNYDTVESEVADVFIVLVTVCNQLNINLFEALRDKEMENCKRNWALRP